MNLVLDQISDAVIARYPTAYILAGCPHFIGRKPLASGAAKFVD